jgi:hypothetical protein
VLEGTPRSKMAKYVNERNAAGYTVLEILLSLALDAKGNSFYNSLCSALTVILIPGTDYWTISSTGYYC